MRDRFRLAFLGLLALYVLLAVAYSLVNPLYESTDELRHFRYVRHIAVFHRLPIQERAAPRAQSHHPPLYYALGALVSGWVPSQHDVYYAPTENPFWGYRIWETGNDNKSQYVHRMDEAFPFQGVALAVYLVRWLTILFGAGTVWMTYHLARAAMPRSPHAALGAVALIAFNPQFLYLSGAINNDVPAALWGGVTLYLCVRLVREGGGKHLELGLGAALGLALLTKLNLLALGLPVVLAYLVVFWRDRNARQLARAILITGGLTVVLSGWWFGRNLYLYGDPSGMKPLNELWAGRSAREGFWALGQALPYLWSSLWGRFGYGQVPLSTSIYQGLLAFAGVTLLGHLLPRRPHMRSADIGLLLATVLASLLIVLYYITIQPAGAMGRFLFPALPALAILLASGFARLLPLRWRWASGAIPILGMGMLAIHGFVILVHAFAPPPSLSASDVAALSGRPVTTFVSAETGPVADLLDYKVEPHRIEPGDVIRVQVTWRVQQRTAQDYAVFVHLLSDMGTMVAQRDTFPGLGRYPTTRWDPDTVFVDVYRIHVPDTAYAPDNAMVQVGLYLPEGVRLTTTDGEGAVRIGTVDILARPGEVPNATQVNFGDQIQLSGYELDRRVAAPGETVKLTLYWEPLASMQENYSVFAHVIGVEDQVWASDDGWPVDGQAPTATWRPGQVIQDERELTIGMTTPPGFYTIEVGLYDHQVQRLPILAEDGHWINNRVHLSKVRVIAGD